MVLNYFSSDFCPSFFIIVFHCLTPCLPSWSHDNAAATDVQILPFPLFNYNASGTLYPILYHSNPDFILRRSSSREPWTQGVTSNFLSLFWLWKVRHCWRYINKYLDFFLLFFSAPASSSKKQNVVFSLKLSNKFNSAFLLSAERILSVGLHFFILYNIMCPAHLLRIHLCLTMVMKQLNKERLTGIRCYLPLCPLWDHTA